MGGTSVLYISDVPLDLLWFHTDPGREPLSELTWAALNKVPPIAFGVMGLMAGTHWIIKRRMKMMSIQAAPSEAEGPEYGSDS